MPKNAIDKLVDDPKKILLIVIIIVVCALVLYFFWGKIKVAISGLTTKFQQSSDLSDYQLSTGETVTMNDSEFRQLANKLYSAFYGGLFGWGTDEDAVYAVFKRLTNGADLRKLIAVYGTREDMTLDQAIVDELSGNDLAKLNQILQNKGINYQF